MPSVGLIPVLEVWVRKAAGRTFESESHQVLAIVWTVGAVVAFPLQLAVPHVIVWFRMM